MGGGGDSHMRGGYDNTLNLIRPCPTPRFQAAIRKYGVPDEEIFQTADLFERRNIAQVTLCIFALARIVSSIKSLFAFCHTYVPILPLPTT